MKSKALGVLVLLALQGCYTLKQGYGQAKLLWSREDLEQVIKKQNETPERLAMLEKVPGILDFAQRRIGLETGSSYRKYVRLKGNSVTYVLQAAEKRRLKKKTWWFPIVGNQPYLGFFEEAEARAKMESLKAQGYDVRMGGVPAFSLLGYFPDPLYSSMIDGNELPDLAETLFHECLHLTLYIPNFSAFNENLADYVGKRATELYLEEVEHGGSEQYRQKYLKQTEAQKIFQMFLRSTLNEVEEFYKKSEEDPAFKNEELFLKERTRIFESIAQKYNDQVRPQVLGTGYAFAFQKGRINNAVLLAYSLYEAEQGPFDELFARTKNNVADFVKQLKFCLESKSPETEPELWNVVKNCAR
jgi:predicted aminopeptidase